jgi:Holliday junction resolvase RusA-like endonuclease
MSKACYLMVFVFVISGCAGKVNYIPPTHSQNIQNSKVVNVNKNEVWKKVVSSLGSSFFVINNLDKESGFINLSYSGSPEKYIDCGQIDSYLSNARGKRRYVFPTSTGFKEYETMINGYLGFHKRKMELNGRINIVIQEEAPIQTRVTVNTRYVINKDIRSSNPQGQSYHSNESISFNTNGSSTFQEGCTECCATGKLEQEVFKIIGL